MFHLCSLLSTMKSLELTQDFSGVGTVQLVLEHAWRSKSKLAGYRFHFTEPNPFASLATIKRIGDNKKLVPNHFLLGGRSKKRT